MPSIDVTMGDGATVDATMAGEAIAVEVNGAGYTDRQAVDALDGETVTPGQVGTASDPVTEEHVGSSHVKELSVESLVAEMAHTTSTSIPDSTATTVIYDSVTKEDSQIFDANASTGEITVQKSGVYHVIISVVWETASGWTTGDICRVSVRKNGGTELDGAHAKAGTNNEGQQVSHIVRASAGDVITANVFQNSGNSQNLRGNSKQERFIIARIG